MARKQRPTDAALRTIRETGLTYPGAHTKSPWPGHLDLAVNDKTFAYLGVEGDPFSISCKLPRSSAIALLLPFVTPTAYGLGKSGWVSAKVPDGEAVPVDLFLEWIDESYRAQAPKKLVKQLEAGPDPRDAAPRAAASKPAAKSRAAASKPAAKSRAAKPRTATAKPRAASKPGAAAKRAAAKRATAKPRAARPRPASKPRNAKSGAGSRTSRRT
jgi:predicted DNA-binding protein (MmcQ/YjbR family)